MHSIYLKKKHIFSDVSEKHIHSEKFTFEYQIEKLESVFIREIGADIKFTEMRMEKAPDYRYTGQHTSFFDKDTLSFPMVIRNFRPGDCFSTTGSGRKAKVKKIFY